MTDPSSTDVAAFKHLMAKIQKVNASITVDAGEWGELATICSAATDVDDYAQRCLNNLWTNSEDQGSWQTVVQGARNAAGQPYHAALVAVLTSFTRINDPSHNASQWFSVADTARALLNQIGPAASDAIGAQAEQAKAAGTPAIASTSPRRPSRSRTPAA